ncbi:MAG: hypothetical protein JWO38_1405 [Gemmataceae bacterium]|nr:hypothetical protein [Gemmataceae bacterium]
MFRNWILAAVVLAGSAGILDAQPFPRPLPAQPGPFPPPAPAPARVDGPWYFRGDPRQPCFIETIDTPRGPMLVFTNEKGSQAYGRLGWGGRVIVYDWDLVGYVRGNYLIWPNGDFWSR